VEAELRIFEKVMTEAMKDLILFAAFFGGTLGIAVLGWSIQYLLWRRRVSKRKVSRSTHP